jgi:hypothetical protein
MNGKLNLHQKVAGGGLSGALALIILWVLSYWVKVPVEVGSAFTLLLSFAGAWLSPAGVTKLVAEYGTLFSPLARPEMQIGVTEPTRVTEPPAPPAAPAPPAPPAAPAPPA